MFTKAEEGCEGFILCENTVISPNFRVWKFCGKAQFLQGFVQFARNYMDTVLFHKMSTPGK